MRRTCSFKITKIKHLKVIPMDRREKLGSVKRERERERERERFCRTLYFHIIFRPPLCRLIHCFRVCKMDTIFYKILKYKRKSPFFNYKLKLKKKRKEKRKGKFTNHIETLNKKEEKMQKEAKYLNEEFGVVRRKKINLWSKALSI